MEIIYKKREVWVGESSFYMRPDGILHIITIGDVDDKIAEISKEAVLQLEAKLGKSKGVMVDLNKAGKQSPKARRTWKSMHETGDHPIKLALFGMNPVSRVIASFFLQIMVNKKIKFFTTEEIALNWLKS
jgi:hypothetical protein